MPYDMCSSDYDPLSKINPITNELLLERRRFDDIDRIYSQILIEGLPGIRRSG
jgi:hypothetical protein